MPLERPSITLGDNVSGVITFQSSGDFKKTTTFLKAIASKKMYEVLDSYGQKGVEVLSDNTPVRTGDTAGSWYYDKKVTAGGVCLEWYNSKKASDGTTPLIFLIINGHGTRTGGYVPPNDFVKNSMETVFTEAADAVWKVVTSL